MSKRADYPDLDPAQHHHVLTGGLDDVWIATGAAHSGLLRVAS
jgi:hypothetical protein